MTQKRRGQLSYSVVVFLQFCQLILIWPPNTAVHQGTLSFW